MKRYMLFAGETYYGLGGMKDFIKSDDDLEFLADHANKIKGTYLPPDSRYIEWWHIYDLETEEVVAGTKNQAYPNES